MGHNWYWLPLLQLAGTRPGRMWKALPLWKAKLENVINYNILGVKIYVGTDIPFRLNFRHWWYMNWSEWQLPGQPEKILSNKHFRFSVTNQFSNWLWESLIKQIFPCMGPSDYQSVSDIGHPLATYLLVINIHLFKKTHLPVYQYLGIT